MSDVAAAPVVHMSPKAKKAAKPKKAKTTPSHPPVAEMVNTAIKTLKERKGSSLAAIKKYIAANYKVDVARLAPFIRRYLKSAVTSGKLTQTKGTGAAGSFRIGKEEKPKKPTKAKKAKKPKAAKKSPKKPKAKKVKTPKKAAKKTPKKAAKKTPKKAAKKSPKKAVKPKKPKAKTPAKKAAKPKKAIKPRAKKPVKK